MRVNHNITIREIQLLLQSFDSTSLVYIKETI